MSDLFPKGIIIAAPSSGSGKTVLTLGLLRHLAASGIRAVSAKAGPDYIDPAFHAAASGRPCVNMDPWAMDGPALAMAAQNLGRTAPLVVCEGVMGLFDGATLDSGSTADLASETGWPVVLVIDAVGQGASAAAVLKGFAEYRADVTISGVIFNRVAGDRHANILRDAASRAAPDIQVLGFMPRIRDLEIPSRHLGLVQSVEHPDLPAFLDRAAGAVAENVDVDGLLGLARDWAGSTAPISTGGLLAPLGQKISVARDPAFAFSYPLVIEGWRSAGSEIHLFSPLNDEGPADDADAVYLPGGYPELYGGQLSANARFLDELRGAADRGAALFGECGGYMVLGQGIVDAEGTRHAMSGLLPLETSFAERKLHLGYRRAVTSAEGPLGPAGTVYRGHEFHYATISEEGPGTSLFEVSDAATASLGAAGQVSGRVMGSFIHLIATEDG